MTIGNVPIYDHAAWYDLTYEWKNYTEDSQKLQNIIQQYQQSAGNEVLEVACGTGNYVRHFEQNYAVTGIDINEKMLDEARKKFPSVPFHQADMRDFSLPQQFDVVMCLFSSIAYLDETDLQMTIANFARHTRQGGLVIVEPFVDPDKFNSDRLHFLKVEKPDILISRHSIARRNGNKAIIDFHFLITTLNDTFHSREVHQMSLFEPQAIRQAFENSGLTTHSIDNGLMPDRTLYVGIKA